VDYDYDSDSDEDNNSDGNSPEKLAAAASVRLPATTGSTGLEVMQGGAGTGWYGGGGAEEQKVLAEDPVLSDSLARE
jgi:hypothetical protein